MAKVQIGEELNSNQIVLLLIPSAEYTEVTIDTIKELLCDLDHLKFPARILSLASSFFITTQQKSGVAK